MAQNKYNYKLLHPNGEFFAYCTKRKYNKYIQKNLCKIIDEKTIQLTFTPKIKDTSSFYYVYDIDTGKNVCIVCGRAETCDKATNDTNEKTTNELENEENNEYNDDCEDNNIKLNLHNIVPMEFMKFYPNKCHLNLNNKVLLCDDCKDDYNAHQHKFREDIFTEFDIKFEPNNKKKRDYASAILDENMSTETKINSTDRLAKLLGHTPTQEDIINCSKLNSYPALGDKAPPQYIVDKYVAEGKLDEFSSRWKNHFENWIKCLTQ